MQKSLIISNKSFNILAIENNYVTIVRLLIFNRGTKLSNNTYWKLLDTFFKGRYLITRMYPHFITYLSCKNGRHGNFDDIDTIKDD